ncbi:transcriptional regulator [Nonomuraea sp. NPDC049028]|uniref:transcriptional regulator n=1 Tax=Nonomuraea sp. NPDC049028 TaxID=3364348 RepID=UPI00371FAABE
MTALAGVALPKRADVDETTAATLTGITGAQRRLEAITPARELARPAVAQVDLASRVLGRASRSPYADEVRAGLSEAAGFAAWVHADMQDTGSARFYYRRAIDSARQADNALLAAYMIGSLAAFEIDADDPLTGLNLLARARREIGERPPATARAWLLSIEALGHASARDESAALQALRAAESAVRAGERAVAPPWPWVFPFDHAKLAGYRALVMVRLKRPAEAVAAFNESLASAQPGAKQRGVLMTEVAAAQAMSGHYDEALYLASNALTVGTTYGSERVLHRVRTFRRAYGGPPSNALRSFDERLHATLL